MSGKFFENSILIIVVSRVLLKHRRLRAVDFVHYNARLPYKVSMLSVNNILLNYLCVDLYVLGTHKDEAFLKLKRLLAPFGITRFYTDDWGAYQRHLDPTSHEIGKQNTQKIERKHLTLRTRIKRLARKTICFSKTVRMHDIVIGLFVNRYEFGVLV
jgi:IS1 family transposase